MLKAQELRLRTTMDQTEKKYNELCVKAQSASFNHEIKELKAVAKERHIFFVQDVKKVREDVNLKIEELHSDVAKEVATLDQNYSSLHTKVDIIADVVTNVVKWYNTLLAKFDSKADSDAQEVAQLKEILNTLKESVSNLGSSSSSFLTPDYLT
ncbi:unnamed protein product [Lactuca saligna]|uniref:Uncharacterized protein n=1 Tax=Lactuca saligna TaxID=75948 RepID=A0AA36EBN3_LACSI|nr:unnamed protein product [Lactuca saligna]